MEHRDQDVLTITALVRRLTGVIENAPDLSRVWVQGEISNFKRHMRGHMYFTLKDDRTKVRAVMFASHNRRLRFLPKDGDDVLVRGRMAVYERDGQVQLYVTHMQPNGIGERYVAFQQLKEKLEAEGLFSPDRKKPLPFLPRRVGVITSPVGAAVRDIITTIQRRSPVVDILVHPVAVQGSEAPGELVEALDRMNREGEVDVIIIGRGGGSLEELWAFNEETVARAIHRSRIPVVSAVGHETDTTISDFVADVRAPTPTAAAELVAPGLQELISRLKGVRERLFQAVRLKLRSERDRWERANGRPVLKKPGARVEVEAQKLDLLTQDLIGAGRERFTPCRSRLESRIYRLQGHRPSARIRRLRERLAELTRQAGSGMERRFRDERTLLLKRLEHLDALSPLKVMQRGYSLVYRFDGEKLVKSANDVQPGDLIRIRLSDGRLKCQVWGTEGDSHVRE
ncbi:exodeoxyribonuclease VII large subunit [Melghirimyces profundicolus]|uniref:Exodeoxyribonuclease 7 large subunit n=1 Tax=Melghirimyces profundicolus TaxID=1242148 RepID=A0A2T6BCY6_9BACL|nr:exodeoxyribonuclease VII large subunit [Melghirimyces profundicolus]PTX53930.1 exodeoxyribonuclease VII large subunit [Melghirimyces profundicolus]